VIPFLLETASASTLPGHGAVVELLDIIGSAGLDEVSECGNAQHVVAML
jgi:hypothetical protein